MAFAQCWAGSAQMSPRILWQQGFGGTRGDYLSTVLPTSDGGYLLGGLSDSAPGGNKTATCWDGLEAAGGGDFWVVRTDAQGVKLWDKSYGGSWNETLEAALSTSDGGFLLVGYSNSGPFGPGAPDGNKYAFNQSPRPDSYGRGAYDGWVVRIDSAGNRVWDATYGGTQDDQLYGALATSDGGFLLVGWSKSGGDGNKTAPSRGGMDAWVVKIDANGNKQWDQSYGGNSDDAFTDIVAAPDGGYLLAGVTSSGVSGNKTSTGTGTWLVKIDSQGNLLWENAYSGGYSGYNGLNAHSGLLARPDGGYLVAVPYSGDIAGARSVPKQGPIDVWLFSVDASGHKQWEAAYGPAGPFTANIYFPGGYAVALLAAPAGGYLLAASSSQAGGNKTAPLYGYEDHWLARIDKSGNKLWDASYGGNGDDYLAALIAAPDGGYLLGGASSSDQGTGVKTTPRYGLGGVDYWLVKVAAEPFPVINSQPQSLTASGGATATFSVTGFSFDSPLTYQWQHNTTNIVGATNATLTITNVTPADAGAYVAVLSNSAGPTPSATAILTYSDASTLELNLYAGLTLFGTPGKTYRIEYAEQLVAPVNWTFLANVTFATAPQLWVDTTGPALTRRYYRVILQP